MCQLQRPVSGFFLTRALALTWKEVTVARMGCLLGLVLAATPNLGMTPGCDSQACVWRLIHLTKLLSLARTVRKSMSCPVCLCSVYNGSCAVMRPANAAGYMHDARRCLAIRALLFKPLAATGTAAHTNTHKPVRKRINNLSDTECYRLMAQTQYRVSMHVCVWAAPALVCSQHGRRMIGL